MEQTEYRNRNKVPKFRDPDKDEQAGKDVLRYLLSEQKKLNKQLLFSTGITNLLLGTILLFAVAWWLRG